MLAALSIRFRGAGIGGSYALAEDARYFKCSLVDAAGGGGGGAYDVGGGGINEPVGGYGDFGGT